MIEHIAQARTVTARSSGGVIIDALEYAYDQLGTALTTRPSTGTRLFGATSARGGRRDDGTLATLNIRLLDEDYAKLDDLAEEFGARSRGQLVTAALRIYLPTITTPRARTRKRS